MVKATWQGWRITEVREYDERHDTVEIAVDCSLYPTLLWVKRDDIELEK